MQHTLIIGFKHVGKSVVGQQLAKKFAKTYCDLDEAVEALHESRTQIAASCREIMRQHGSDYFRRLEHEALKDALASNLPMVISLGGGTPLREDNQQLMRGHEIIHVTADKGKVYERIMVNGRPAFFPEGKNSYLAFSDLWQERESLYRRLSKMTVDNSKSLDQTVSVLHGLLLAQ